MRIILQYAINAFNTIPQSEWIRHVYAWVNAQENGLVKVERPEWLDRARVKYHRYGAAQGGFKPQGQLPPGPGRGNVVEGEFTEIGEDDGGAAFG